MARYSALGWLGVLFVLVFCVSVHHPVLPISGTLRMLIAAIRGDDKWFVGAGFMALLIFLFLLMIVGHAWT